jgi:hypothetical protein
MEIFRTRKITLFKITINIGPPGSSINYALKFRCIEPERDEGGWRGLWKGT